MKRRIATLLLAGFILCGIALSPTHTPNAQVPPNTTQTETQYALISRLNDIGIGNTTPRHIKLCSVNDCEC